MRGHINHDVYIIRAPCSNYIRSTNRGIFPAYFASTVQDPAHIELIHCYNGQKTVLVGSRKFVLTRDGV